MQNIKTSFLDALESYRKGGMIIMVDDQDRENEGDLVVASQVITEEQLIFMERYARGLTCITLSHEQTKKLQLPMQTINNNSPFQTAFTVSVDHRSVLNDPITAKSRVKTLRELCSPNAEANDFVVPGNVYPLAAHPQGTIGRRGQTEGSHDLSRIAGFSPSGIICEILNPDGSMARGASLISFAEQHNLPIISVADVLRYRIDHEILLKEINVSLKSTDYGQFTVHTFLDEVEDKEHFVLVYGKPDYNKDVLVRIHSECLTGDVFSSRRCDCGPQLEKSISAIKEAGSGVLLYLRQEGRGIGLLNKIKAYALQDQGHDTVEANVELGLDADLRDFAVAAKILQILNVKKLRLLTNNPEKVAVLESFGLNVSERIPLLTEIDAFSISYLETKRDKLGHYL
jgi:3,4-dihydroxy 2-butanone 4-phosphate synthase/GTP cyclohydrolase II